MRLRVTPACTMRLMSQIVDDDGLTPIISPHSVADVLSSVFAPARASVSHRQGEQPEGETMTATAAWCHSTP